jgi:YbgC/YbaW family acyl-CoA thioester hydrolase
LEKIRYRQLSEVAFSDTDASGWVHFSKILSYMENAEHGFLSSIGIPVFDPAQGGWPRARVRCDYRSPLRFQDSFEVRLSLSKIGTTSIHWQFEIVKSDTTLAAEGEMVSVKVDSTGTPSAITEAERAKLLG